MARTPKADPEVEITEVAIMKKPELLDAVVTRTAIKRRDVKPAVEAALAVIGDALRDGTVVNLPPLGKLRLVKSKTLDGGAAVLTLKLRTPKNAAVAALGDPET